MMHGAVKSARIEDMFRAHTISAHAIRVTEACIDGLRNEARCVG